MGLEFDNFKSWLKSGFSKFLSWLNGTFVGGDDVVFKKRGSQDLSDGTT